MWPLAFACLFASRPALWSVSLTIEGSWHREASRYTGWSVTTLTPSPRSVWIKILTKLRMLCFGVLVKLTMLQQTNGRPLAVNYGVE